MRRYAEDKCIESADYLLESIVGIDCNPLAVLTARTNYLLHAGDLLDCTQERELPVYCADSVTLERARYPFLCLPFDYVVGNPPWIVWDDLPQDYRTSTQPLWKMYGLFTLTPSQARHGGGKKDISMLFTYACADKYLKDTGTFGFLITQSVFKTKGAGEGFRKFRLKNATLKILEVHDFVRVHPFERAHTRTAAIVLRKGEKTVYPVKYMVWNYREKPSGNARIYATEMAALPSDPDNELSPWITVPCRALGIVQKACGKNAYSIYEGINSGGANSIYQVTILDRVHESGRELIVENLTEDSKKKVKKVKKSIENYFVYPLVKSRHAGKWKIKGYNYTLQMRDPKKRIGFEEEWVKKAFPKTYTYLKEFEEVLLNRVMYRKFMKSRKAPFYTMYNVGTYTYAPYKVVWNRMGSGITACVISLTNDKYLGEKSILPDNVLAFIPTDDEDEAHYICGVMNSCVVDMILRTVAGGTKSFAAPRIVKDTIRIPEYDRDNELCKALSVLSKKAHGIAQKDGDTTAVEKEINKLVAVLYSMSEGELATVREALRVQKGG